MRAGTYSLALPRGGRPRRQGEGATAGRHAAEGQLHRADHAQARRHRPGHWAPSGRGSARPRLSATANPSSSSSTVPGVGRVLHRADPAVQRRPVVPVEDPDPHRVVERRRECARRGRSGRARPGSLCTASFHACVVLLNAVQGLNASMKLKPGCWMPSTISSVSSFERKLAPRATNEQSAAIAVASDVHRLLEVAERRRGRLLLVQRGRRDLALREAVGLVVHDHVGDVDVAARGVREVAAADREAVAVAADRDHVELGVGQLHAHRGRAARGRARRGTRRSSRTPGSGWSSRSRTRSPSGPGPGRARRTPGRRPRARRSRRSPGTRSASGPT